MEQNVISYSNSMGELISPLLMAIRSTGFFEAYVFIPVMTLLSIVLFMRLRQRIKSHGILLQVAAYTLCFLLTNSTAVAFKTLLIQELDYEQLPWFLPYLSPLHFYISSVALAHIYLMWHSRPVLITRLLCAYIQIGLIGGYSIAVYRLIYEPIELTDVTTGISGFFLLAWFGLLNWDIKKRFFDPEQTGRKAGRLSGASNTDA